MQRTDHLPPCSPPSSSHIFCTSGPLVFILFIIYLSLSLSLSSVRVVVCVGVCEVQKCSRSGPRQSSSPPPWLATSLHELAGYLSVRLSVSLCENLSGLLGAEEHPPSLCSLSSAPGAPPWSRPRGFQVTCLLLPEQGALPLRLGDFSRVESGGSSFLFLSLVPLKPQKR